MPTLSRALSRGRSLLLLDRRSFIVGAASVLAGCTAAPQVEPLAYVQPPDPYYVSLYAAIPGERFPIPAVDVSAIDPKLLRQEVPYDTSERTGTIVVDPDAKFLYLVLENGRALRYGVGVGREGFSWSGRAIIQRKAEWPIWTPPRSMIEREPRLVPYANGMPPGLKNPLGARALYLYQNGRDTLYRLHGTNEPLSIGRAVSSGCIRLFNQDIIDLYNRVPVDSPVVVLANGGIQSPEL